MYHELYFQLPVAAIPVSRVSASDFGPLRTRARNGIRDQIVLPLYGVSRIYLRSTNALRWRKRSRVIACRFSRIVVAGYFDRLGLPNLR